jgi:MFS family permease
MHTPRSADPTESPYAWLRLAVATLISTVGGVGMWSFAVVLPAVQADLGLVRADASLPYTATMVGFAIGGIVFGRLADRFGVIVPVILGAAALSAGYVAASYASGLVQLSLAYGLLIGVGTSASFAPLVADTSHWFSARRGTAVAICASGNYLAGVFWPPLVQHFTVTQGWRATHFGIGLFCVCAMLPLALVLRRRTSHTAAAAPTRHSGRPDRLGLTPSALQVLLSIAGVACCVAMAMPQVHIVAYCGDLGYGVARGAEMLSLMLGFGIVSRVGSGIIADRIGGIRTLLLGSVLQGLALFLYALFDGLASLYVISALFGLFQGGIVPSYAIIIREYFPAREIGGRLGIVIMATLVGMALGGWMSGVIFDFTGSYRAAFLHGLMWNALNVAIATWLLMRNRRGAMPAAA